ncbi:hypothetical protein GLOIN_2v836970 [Rhizophagus irregularis DAOM 181602=DAOM 197198]|uniref:Uncharacterized protein n=1 Tax=Rhizophagus irregularis (strain DAOM 181602 / DAOM 197198 / MUCL 43194) TaxID=747089 RepID=A0A2P4P2C2_RHIID|nr:hypothetical protein GLOIN_2v836970 [Rhizophagus irregularis DAOM 181602=DAOM 197198]POG59522.1 hypothetical protein GLOIN_2v836970 [Rhizophagus irregularis DAOM 181602=DAOM 197198]|eukprot:XP_025166388.1 hypothetical protein GLOIN_2v836970 [Rhizophagus irregularis DAOM 181602=DAOM 197198]
MMIVTMKYQRMKKMKAALDYQKKINMLNIKLNELDNNPDRESLSPGRLQVAPVSTPIDSYEVNGGL